ncbi:MAG: hypothetical protein HZA88_08520 [Verrucomicrobia bacterium]|nr:hypothetical protein [Verrucomicrobiota bacterium]
MPKELHLTSAATRWQMETDDAGRERHGFTVLAESHWSVEFGPFHILQTILNALGCSCN